MGQKLDDLRLSLLTKNGGVGSEITTADVWDRYLRSAGYTTGTVLERQLKHAAALGVSRNAYLLGAFEQLSSELAGSATDALWTTSLNGGAAGSVVSDGTGIHFVAANNIASVLKNGVAIVDNATYEISFTIANYQGGGARVLIGGATTNHGFTSTTRSANGTYTERGQTIATFGSTNIIRIQATGASGTNSFDVTSISVKRVL